MFIGSAAVSFGVLALLTGSSVRGPFGAVRWASGQPNEVSAGSGLISPGSGPTGEGGPVPCFGGDMTGTPSTGVNVEVNTGVGSLASGSSNERATDPCLQTGNSAGSNVRSVSIKTGASQTGAGVSISAGTAIGREQTGGGVQIVSGGAVASAA